MTKEPPKSAAFAWSAKDHDPNANTAFEARALSRGGAYEPTEADATRHAMTGEEPGRHVDTDAARAGFIERRKQAAEKGDTAEARKAAHFMRKGPGMSHTP